MFRSAGNWPDGIAVASTGYAHPKVVSAVQEAAGRFFSMCSTDFYYPEMSDLCERLAKLGPGPEKKRVFLTNSGTEATMSAIRLARGVTGRARIVKFDGNYHGHSDSLLAGAGSGVAAYHFLATSQAESRRAPGSTTDRDSTATHTQAFYVVGPQGPQL